MLAGFALLGMGLSASFPTALALAGDRFRATGTVFGPIMTVALVGGTVGPTVGAWLAKTGPEKVLCAPLVSAILVATFVLILAGRDSSVS
jgi:fucose permease